MAALGRGTLVSAAPGSGMLVVAAALSRSALSVCWLCAWRVVRGGVLVVRGVCGGYGVRSVRGVRGVPCVRCVRVSRGRRGARACAGRRVCAGWRLPSFSAVRSKGREGEMRRA